MQVDPQSPQGYKSKRACTHACSSHSHIPIVKYLVMCHTGPFLEKLCYSLTLFLSHRHMHKDRLNWTDLFYCCCKNFSNCQPFLFVPLTSTVFICRSNNIHYIFPASKLFPQTMFCFVFFQCFIYLSTLPCGQFICLIN